MNLTQCTLQNASMRDANKNMHLITRHTTVLSKVTHCPTHHTQPFTSHSRSSNKTASSSIVAQAGFGKASKNTAKTTCPCGSGAAYNQCCKPYHKGTSLPETAEQLMRSRYSAYAKALPEYVVDTTHPENPLHPDTIEKDSERGLKEDVVATCQKINWEKLKVLKCEDGKGENEAYVTFQTWFKVRGQEGQRAQGWFTQSFIEKSRFLRENGKWLYVNGDQEWQNQREEVI